MTGSLDYRKFADLVSEVQDIISDDSETAERMIKDAMNRRYAEISQAAEFSELLATESTGLRRTDDAALTALMAGDAYYPLPWNCARIKSLHFQDSTIGGELELMDATELFARAGSQLDTAGLPCYAAIHGMTAQYRALPTAQSVNVMSSISNNDNGPAVRVHFERSSSYPDVDNWQDVSGAYSLGVALNSPCAAGYPIKEIYVPPAWVGGLQCVGASDATEIVAIRHIEEPVTNMSDNFQVAKRLLLRVWPVPDAGYKLTTVFWKRPLRMTEDEDTPAIPVSGWLVSIVAADMLRSEGKSSLARDHAGNAGELAKAVVSREKQPERTVLRPYMGSFTRSTGYGSWRGGNGNSGY